MARGAPDYSNVSSPQTFHRLDDLAELAIRQGHIASVDRLGTTLLCYDFCYGAGPIITLDAGLGESPSIKSGKSLYGGFSLDLDRVANANSYSGFLVGVPFRTLSKSGVEVIFSIYTALPNLKLYIYRHTETERIEAGLRWDTTTGKVYIGGDTAGWEDTGDEIQTLSGLAMQHSMKLVLDEENREYVRAYVSGQPITLPDKDPRVQVIANEPKTYLYFYNGLDPVAASDVYVDAFIITYAEP